MRLSIPTASVWAGPPLPSSHLDGRIDSAVLMRTLINPDDVSPDRVAWSYQPIWARALEVENSSFQTGEQERRSDDDVREAAAGCGNLRSFPADLRHAAQAIRPAARHFGATFLSMISTSVRKAINSADISHRIRALCGLLLAICRASSGRPRFL